MKKIILSLFTCLAIQQANAQLVITPNQTASYLANKLVATSGSLGVTVSNATLTCHANANGEFTGTSNLGISDGIALGTGDVASDTVNNIFGLDGIPLEMASNVMSTLGDADLTTITTLPTYDACVLEFDLQPSGSFIEFEYVFGSEEYPEFNCSPFNDVFGFFISGPGFSTPTNIALIPSTTTEVSINSINDGSVASCTSNTALYVNNIGTTCIMDGFTVPMIATASVTSGATYHLKMAIADASDAILNSYVILKANSLKSGNTTPNNLNQLSKEAGLEVYPTVLNNAFYLNNLNGDQWNIEISDINGRMVYRTVISANQSTSSIQTEGLSKGMYVLKASRNSDHRSFIQKLIKE
ncbi:MAG TPA: choice-of-anchor L domain-containing protein [Chitinophagaceae bacterium]|nr:choice-of-anchor L domain-containing protein [Chitinophagaceae bacterium]